MKTLLLSKELWEVVEVGYTRPANKNALNALIPNQRNQLKEDRKKDYKTLFSIVKFSLILLVRVPLALVKGP